MNEGFLDAVGRFERFLQNAGYPGHVRWIRPRDVVLVTDRRIFIRVRNNPSDQYVRDAFDLATRAGRGILFAALCSLERATCCYVWVPQDKNEAADHLMSDKLKLSAPTGEGRFQGYAVSNALKWVWLRVRYLKLQRFTKGMFN